MGKRSDCIRQYGELAEREESNNQAAHLFDEGEKEFQAMAEASAELAGPLPACNQWSSSFERVQEIFEKLKELIPQPKSRLAPSMSRNRQTQDDK